MLRAAPDQRRPYPGGEPHRHRARRRLIPIMLVIALMLAPVEFSIGQALTAPGQATVSVRMVEWLRDHGAAPLVNTVENWWYAHNRPGGAAPAPGSLPTVPAATGGLQPGTTLPGATPPALPLISASRLPGEAVWTPTARRVGAAVPLYTAYFRPDLQTPSVVAGVAWLNQSLVRTRLIAGTTDPAGPSRAATVDGSGAQVPAALRATLLATFNSGFKLKDARGGYYTRGRQVQTLRDGAASLAIDSTGRVDIGQWGRDLTLTPRTVAVRQNLDLIVDRAAPVPGLASNITGAWGSTNNQLQYTWRSGLGLDAAGNLIYVAADKISLADLAHAMAAAGVVRGMQLDIHPQMVTFLAYRPGQATTAGAGTRLLPAMVPPTTRYLRPDQRDFLAVTTSP